MLRLLFLAVALAGTPTPKAVTVTASDGVKLAGLLTAPPKATNGVLLLHQEGRGKEDWGALARALARDGNLVLAMDLRGQAANTRADQPLVAEDYLRMETDVSAAIALLKSQGATRVALVGAELGANLAVNAAIEEPAVVSIVMLSPALDLHGVIASDAVPRYGNRPLLLIAAADDRAGARAAGVLDTRAVGPHEYRLLERGGRGAQLLLRDPLLEGVIAGWIGTWWESAPAAAPPATRESDLLRPLP
jgi:dienelactone hydrolase